MISKQRRAWTATSGSTDPSGQMGAVPEISDPIARSNGPAEPDGRLERRPRTDQRTRCSSDREARLDAVRTGAGGPIDLWLVRSRLREHADDLMAHLVQVDAERLEHARRDALALAHETQQEVLRADVVVAQATRLVDGQLDDPLGTGRQPHLAQRGLITGTDDELDRDPHLRQVDVHLPQDPRRHPVGHPHQAQEQVLRPDVAVVEPLRLVLRERQDMPGAVRELVEAVARGHQPGLR